MKRLNGSSRLEPIPETATPLIQIDAQRLNYLIEQVEDVLACNGGGTLGHQVKAQTKKAVPGFLGYIVAISVVIAIPLLPIIVSGIIEASHSNVEASSSPLPRREIEVRRAELVNPRH